MEESESEFETAGEIDGSESPPQTPPLPIDNPDTAADAPLLPQTTAEAKPKEPVVIAEET